MVNINLDIMEKIRYAVKLTSPQPKFREGIRDEGLLESAIAKQEYQEDDFMKISSVVYGILKNHPYFDGNKRTGFLLTHLLLNLEGFFVDPAYNQIIANHMINIAESDSSRSQEMVHFFAQGLKSMVLFKNEDIPSFIQDHLFVIASKMKPQMKFLADR